MDCTSVFCVLVVRLLVLPTGGIPRNMYAPPFRPVLRGCRGLIRVAWAGGVDASLSMDGGFKGPSRPRKKGTTSKLHGRLQMSHVLPHHPPSAPSESRS
jgi:hypothetical protein